MGEFAKGKAVSQTDNKHQTGTTAVKKGWNPMLPTKVCVEFLAI